MQAKMCFKRDSLMRLLTLSCWWDRNPSLLFADFSQCLNILRWMWNFHQLPHCAPCTLKKKKENFQNFFLLKDWISLITSSFDAKTCFFKLILKIYSDHFSVFNCRNLIQGYFKGTVAQDFWPLVFFMNRPHRGP